MELKCGCRPCDTWCPTARRMRRDLKDKAASLSLIKIPSSTEEALMELGAAERALRDHLRGEVVS